jgi:uncharacterized repeat protein (TIGR04076 family)
MSMKLPTCKITVLKRTVNHDLIREYLEGEDKSTGFCECFHDGQEFILKSEADFQQVPQDFCDWAWADIRRDILTVAFGGNMPGMKQKGTLVTGCTDWFRPVIFKVERMENG